MQRRVLGHVFTDTDVRDGYINYDGLDFFMSVLSFRALMRHSLMGDMLDAIEALGPGMHLMSRSVIENATARELHVQLQYVEPGESDQCSLPTCLQDAVSRERGYPLCTGHAAQMQDWDRLIAE